MRSPLTVAAVQPACAAYDVAANAAAHARAAKGAVALVGAPIEDKDGRTFIATLRIDGAGVQVAYRRSWVGDREATRFAPGDGPTVLEVDGWRLGLGICRDTGAAQHTVGTAARGVDVYVAGLVHRPEELPEQEGRAVVIARTCRAYVVFASFAGATGDVFSETAGRSAIWSPHGLGVARTGPDVGNTVAATLT